MFTSYIIIAFLIIEGFSSESNDLHGNTKAHEHFLQIILEAARKFNISIDQSTSLATSNQTGILFFNVSFITNYNHNTYNNNTNTTIIYPSCHSNDHQSITQGLNTKCIYQKDCYHIPYSECMLGNCSCKYNYLTADGRCLALIAEACETDSDCGVSESSCQLGYCACKTGYYSSNNTKCDQFPASELHKPCKHHQHCKVPFSKCFCGYCKCKTNYIEHDNVCYAQGGEQCNSSNDCITIWRSCVSGTCQLQEKTKCGKKYASRPGATAIWGPHLFRNISNHNYNLGTHSYQDNLKLGNLAWVQNFTLDKVVLYYRARSPLILWCRAKTGDGKFTSGKVAIPGDGLCKVDYNGDKFSTRNYSVLVDLGKLD